MSPPSWIVPDDLRQTTDRDDDAPSIRRAIALAARDGGTVHFLAHPYWIRTPILISSRVRLSGEGWEENGKGGSGTWFCIVGTNFTPITLAGAAVRGTVIENVAFLETGQPKPGAGRWHPLPYPAVIAVNAVPGSVEINDTFWADVTNGISVYLSGRTHIQRMHGQFFDNAVSIDKAYDQPSVVDLRNWPYWSSVPEVIAYMQAKTVTLRSGRDDTPFMDRIFSYSTLSGITLQATPDDRDHNRGGPTTGAMIGSLSCDGVKYCLEIRGGGHTVQIANFNSGGQAGTNSGGGMTGAAAIHIADDGSAFIQVANMSGAFYAAPIVDSDRSACSVIDVGSAYFNYAGVQGNRVAYLDDVPCGPGNSYDQLRFGIRPQTSGIGSTIKARASSTGHSVFYTQETVQSGF